MERSWNSPLDSGVAAKTSASSPSLDSGIATKTAAPPPSDSGVGTETAPPPPSDFGRSETNVRSTGSRHSGINFSWLQSFIYFRWHIFDDLNRIRQIFVKKYFNLFGNLAEIYDSIEPYLNLNPTFTNYPHLFDCLSKRFVLIQKISKLNWNKSKQDKSESLEHLRVSQVL